MSDEIPTTTNRLASVRVTEEPYGLLVGLRSESTYEYASAECGSLPEAVAVLGAWLDRVVQ